MSHASENPNAHSWGEAASKFVVTLWTKFIATAEFRFDERGPTSKDGTQACSG
ncbi:MAG TPA: hypothetical protein VFE47_02880 [Tepidisphaeraceae bacterium]|nr:hypothetical protein [Tepidisphaeraceae bacterium]